MPNEEPGEHVSRPAEVRAARIEKLRKLRERGIDPYPASAGERESIAAAREKGEGGETRIAGRLVLLRKHGGSTFANLRDASGELQLMFRRDVVGPEHYALLDWLLASDVSRRFGRHH